jgi:hypothetical protein
MRPNFGAAGGLKRPDGVGEDMEIKDFGGFMTATSDFLTLIDWRKYSFG